jgi:RNA polymerase sigma-70 factor (ECF subfamily)
MRKLLAPIIAGLILACLGGASRAADAPTLANVPPVVVKTEPQAGAGDVPASTTEIRVIFSKKMQDKSWSWVTVTPESFPKLAGDPHFSADLLTCVLPVSLEAGKTYAIWINAAAAQNFQDGDGRKAVPYLLVFGTK